MQTLLLVRHGNTRWNTKHLIQGKTVSIADGRWNGTFP